MVHFVSSAEGFYLIQTVTRIRSFFQQRSAGTVWLFTGDPITFEVGPRLGIAGPRFVPEAAYWLPTLTALPGHGCETQTQQGTGWNPAELQGRHVLKAGCGAGRFSGRRAA